MNSEKLVLFKLTYWYYCNCEMFNLIAFDSGAKEKIK